MSIVVLCPTRGRPEAAKEVRETFLATVVSEDTHLLFVVDDDDPSLQAYRDTVGDGYVMTTPGGNMVKALNHAALDLIEKTRFAIFGFIGDDHRFRTPGWDTVVEAALAEPGIAYGDDLFQRERLATQAFMSREIVEALGWFALPTQRHLYVDDAWMQLGYATETLVYMPEVVIEHMHPLAGKAQWDAGYQRVNAQAVYDGDWKTYDAWRQQDLPADAEKVRAALERPAAA